MLILMPFCANAETSSLCAAADAGVDTGACACAVIEVFFLMLYDNTNSYRSGYWCILYADTCADAEAACFVLMVVLTLYWHLCWCGSCCLFCADSFLLTKIYACAVTSTNTDTDTDTSVGSDTHIKADSDADTCHMRACLVLLLVMVLVLTHCADAVDVVYFLLNCYYP